MKKKKQTKKTATAKPAKVPEAKPYKIESGIKLAEPIQRTGNGLAGRFVVTAGMMKVGDSFMIKDEVEALRVEKQMRDLNRRERLSGHTRVFVSRRLKVGMRFWRTA